MVRRQAWLVCEVAIFAIVILGCAQGRTGEVPMDGSLGQRDGGLGSRSDAGEAFPDAPWGGPDAGPLALDAAPLGGDAGPREDAYSLSCAPRTLCGGACVGTNSDPNHCGGCGQVCTLPFATATCVAGRCTVERCESGRGDCNASADDGCEASCSPGACTTSCGSTGAQVCVDVCAPRCTPPAETCNARDDDCDGACDEGLTGCREDVARAYHTTLGVHLYTRSLSEATAAGYTIEQAAFFQVYPSGQPGLVPLYRCRLASSHRLYTRNASCEGASGAISEGVLGYVSATPTCDAKPLYRLATTGNHFYTTSAAERDYAVSIGYVAEGIAAYVW